MEPKSPLVRTLVRERQIAPLQKAQSAFESFSPTEKAAFFVCAAILIGATLSLVSKASAQFSVSVPHKGGSLVEGISGTPRFINPLLAVSDADRDLSTLVYSGLLKQDPSGTYVPDLAESYQISPDGRTYTFVLRKDAEFQDGKPVTADDVLFTVQKAQDPTLKSPRRVSWEGVATDKTDSRTVVFTLKQPYTPFIANLTTGILPKHVWAGLETDQFTFSQKNINAIGSGPYKIENIVRSGDNIPTEIDLRANKQYALGEPNITDLRLKFYPSEKTLAAALKDGQVESAANLSPTSAKSLEESAKILRAPLTRVFGIFFNQNENELLAQKNVRKALDLSIQKGDLIQSVLQGYGSEANGPLPPTVAEVGLQVDDTATSTPADLAAAESLLAKDKWKKNSQGVYELKGKTGSTTLALSLSTANIPELVDAAREIEENWKTLGVQTDVRVFEPSDLNQSVIRPRKYDALLFGIVTGKGADLYPFWHSSQRNDPGLNIALYTNAKADKSLEKMRTATSTEVVASEYKKLEAEINSDTPAIFLWSPDFIYAVPKKLKGVELGEITTSSDRFAGIEKWYVDTDSVWRIFIKDDANIIKN